MTPGPLPMDESTGRLWQLAVAAKQHAWDEHSLQLSPADWSAVDGVLVKERAASPAARLEMLAACYGAWLGFWANTALEGFWTGLHEPTAPRVCVGGEVFSPIEAIRRILLDQPDAVSVSEIASRLHRCKAEAQRGRVAFLQDNESAWDQRASDDRFTAASTLPLDPAAAMLAIDPWLQAEGIVGRDLLCLAAGGGLHGPLYAIAGARVTVVDLSDRQLDHDRRMAEQLGIEMRMVRQSIDRLDELNTGGFDVVVQPVSSCYLPDLAPMYTAVARVLRPGGLYISQHKQPASLQGSDCGGELGYRIGTPLVEGLRLPAAEEESTGTREPGTAEFLHSLQAILGGLCDAGFVIEGFSEPPRGDAFAAVGSPAHRARFLPPYLKIKARRR